MYVLSVLLLGVFVLFIPRHSTALERDKPIPVPREVFEERSAEKSAVNRYDPLQYIPKATVDKWRTQGFLVVFGIPSEDGEGRRRRRNLQRKTCWQYDGVATKANEYSGSMLVLYILGRSPEHQHKYTPEMLQEAGKWNDIVALDLNEANKSVTLNKTIGFKGYWGVEASIGISFKTFRWFDLALRAFPRARYVTKGDDDMFVHVPQYLADFKVLPPRGVIWGATSHSKNYTLNVNISYPFFNGVCMTFERSLAEAIVFYEPLRYLAMNPHNKSLAHNYSNFAMHGDDDMMSLAVKLSGYKNVTYIKESCRFVLYAENIKFTEVNPYWVIVHHIAESEYENLMNLFANVPVYAFRSARGYNETTFRFLCSTQIAGKKGAKRKRK